MKNPFAFRLGRRPAQTTRPSRQLRRLHRPRVEALEQRLLLSTSYDDGAGIGGFDSAGNVYVLGSYHQSVDLDPGPGTSWTSPSPNQTGPFLAKYSPNMTLQWARSGSQLPTGFVVGESLAVYQDPSTGQTVIYADGGNVVAKYDTAGNLLQSWNTPLLYHIAVGADGSLYGIGSFSGTIDLDPAHVSPGDTLTANGQDAYLDKWDANGNFQWAQQIGGAGTEWQTGLAMQNGVLYVTGMFNGTLSPTGFTDAGLVGSGNTQDGFLLAYDSAGNFLAGDQFVDLSVTAPAVDSTGIYLAGQFTFADADADPGPGQYILPGNPNGGTTAACAIKLNLNADGTPGAFNWADALGGSSSTNSIAVYGGNVYLAGTFYNTVDFNPDPNLQYNLTAAGGNDAFAMQLTSTGTFGWADQMGSSQSYFVSPAENAGVAVSSTGIFLGGYFAEGPATFGSVNLQGQGEEDGFVARLNSDGRTAWAFGIGSPVRTIDNSTAGYTETGTGWKSWNQGDGYLGNARDHAPSKGADTASWKFTGLPDGTYQVLGHWPASSKNATNAPFAIASGGSPTTVLMDQTLPVNDIFDGLNQGWRILGSLAVSGGTVTVTLNDKANGTVLADAIRVVFQTPPGLAPAASLASPTSTNPSTRPVPVLAFAPVSTVPPSAPHHGQATDVIDSRASRRHAAWPPVANEYLAAHADTDWMVPVPPGAEPGSFMALPLPEDLFGALSFGPGG